MKLNGHTCACTNLTTFKNAARAITGNRNYANLLKSHQVNLFLAGFSHLKPLCGSEKTADENLEACLIVTDKMALEANEVADTIILQGISY